MGYNFGNPCNWAAEVPFRYKNALLTDRSQFDDALPNNWQFFTVMADGSGKTPYFIPIDANGVSQLNNPGGIRALALRITQLSTPSAPTITNAGTAGSTSYSYKIVAKTGSGRVLGFTPASSAGTTTTGNATLTTAHYNVITFAAVADAAAYDIYRSASSGTPSTTGKIGSVTATIDASTQVQTTSYAFNDTGIAGDSVTAPTTNTTGAFAPAVVPGEIVISQLATPVGAVTVNGTSGATTITYKIVAKTLNGAVTAASSSITTTTANATLSTTNYNTVSWSPVAGAYSYDIYRTAAGGTPSTTGIIANVLATATLSLNDTGLAGGSETAPTVNTTGAVRAAQASNYVIAGGSSNALTATVPGLSQVAGAQMTVFVGSTTLQAGANTIALNGGSATAIKKASAPTVDLSTAIAANGIVSLVFNGSSWLQLGA
jgi:hypothetical protein